MATRRGLDVTWPWHVILAPVLPVLSLVAANSSELSLRGVLWPLTIGIAAALLIWALVSWLVGDPRTAALSVTVLTVSTLSFAQVARSAVQMGVHPALLYLGLLYGCFALLFASRIAVQTTAFANVLVSVTAIVFGIQIAWVEFVRPRVTAPPLAAEAAISRERPDIYVLIFDGYGRSDVIRDRYGFENDLEKQLTALGFFVADRAYSNYGQTSQSLASSLNLDYLEPLLHGISPAARSRRGLAELISDNRLFRALRAAGYRIASYDSEYDLIRPVADRTLGPWFHASHFAFSYYEGTAFPTILGTLGLPPSGLPLGAHRRNVRWVLDHLERSVGAANEGPALVFAHLLIPHPPFVFNADGSDRATNLGAGIWDGDHWQMAAAGRGERYVDGYVDSLKFLNSRLVAVIERLLNRSRPVTIVLYGDHGPGSQLHFDDPAATDVRERFAILMAMRFHDTDHSTLYSSLSPVNASRALLNSALGTTLPVLEDRSFFATWRRPFELIDVTDRLDH